MRRTKKLIVLVLLCAAVYAGSYVWFRGTHVEVWSQDGREYVIVPLGARLLYYVYRPIMYLDATATGIRFHIGPHRTGE